MTQTIIAYQKYIRQTPRKLRLVVTSLKNQDLKSAISQLKFSRHRAAATLLKVINQAKANAINNHQLKEDDLIIKTIQIMEGATLKRWQPVSRGRAHPIKKRTSHIKVVLQSKNKPSISKSTKPSTTPKATKAKPTTNLKSKTRKVSRR